MKDELSDAAKAVAGVWFGPMGSKTEVVLHLAESRPSPQCQAALDELIAKKIISVKPFNRHGGLVYKPIADCAPYWKWMLRQRKNEAVKFPLMEAIAK